MSKQSKFFILLATTLIVLSGCEDKAPANTQAQTIEVGVITLQEQAIALQQELSGRVKAKLVSQVRPQIGGIIKEQLFKEGSLETTDGRVVSQYELFDNIKDIINSEDKRRPFTDEDITRELGKRSYLIARRTVSKYREEFMGIPNSNKRRICI